MFSTASTWTAPGEILVFLRVASFANKEGSCLFKACKSITVSIHNNPQNTTISRSKKKAKKVFFFNLERSITQEDQRDESWKIRHRKIMSGQTEGSTQAVQLDPASLALVVEGVVKHMKEDRKGGRPKDGEPSTLFKAKLSGSP